MEMTDRKKQILKIVVEEYVAAAEPVGSKAIAQRMPGKISSATIRNELADLTEMGYLEQPHTSAGRVPSAKGYRLYVNELMEHRALSREEEDKLNASLAEKLAGQLTDNVALEVSDSEAKVIHVKQIKTSDESEADAFQRAASQEDADFQSCAEEAGLTVSDRVLGRGDESDAYEKEAFSLAEGAVSQVIHADDAYYVLKCTDDYDEDETAARKERIYEERKKRAFQEIYDRFSNTISVSYSSGLWDSLDLTSEFEKNDADFFEIYAEYAIK